MNEHSLKLLEFEEIKEAIAVKCYMEDTKMRTLNLNPMNNGENIKRELEYTREVMEIIKFDTGLELDGVKEIRGYFPKVELIGTYLDPEEFYNIKESLRILRKAKNKIESLSTKYKYVYQKFKDVAVYKGIEDLISKVVDEEKNIKDEASLELLEIRNNKKNINMNIRRRFEDIINDSSYSQAIQEKIITVRDGRFVIPVKAEFKGQIKGIEHDRSASGQTVFLEPLIAVPLNNKLRELEVREREEIRKILLRLTDVVRNSIDGISEAANALEELDFLNAKAEYGIKNSCNIPKINEREYLKLVNARHPLIAKDKVVPVSFEIGKEYNIMLITGPNTGGKTVTMKTAGLITIMALSGIPVPCDETSDIGAFTGVYADIGDEQSIEQNLSSFSGHLKNIKEILDKVTRNSLILLDELGSGTDPIEGAAFAMSVIDYLKSRKAKVIISTHYSEVKAYGYNQEGIESASMEFNIETLSPTYKLLMGIPGKSNALIIASKLGLSDEIISRAQSYISEEDRKVEKMINNIKEKSDEVEKLREELAENIQNAEMMKKDYERKIIEMVVDRENIISMAYLQADEIVKNMQAKAKALVDKIQSEETKKDEAKEIQKSLNMLKKGIEEEKTKAQSQKTAMPVARILLVPGDKIYLKNIKQDAVVLRVYQEKQELQVQAGILKLVVNIKDIEKITETKEKKYVKTGMSTQKRVTYEVDVRGMTVDEAVIEVENYLDGAVLNGYKEVCVIHGKGTGKLRKELQDFLRTSRYVHSYRDANMNEGGLGATMVTLR
jgi:DNA mismatch repair protein MutS2